MRPSRSSKGRRDGGVLNLALNHAVDVFSALVVLAAIWHILHKGISPKPSNHDTKSANWLGSIFSTNNERDNVVETRSAAIPAPTVKSIFSLFTDSNGVSDQQPKIQSSKTASSTKAAEVVNSVLDVLMADQDEPTRQKKSADQNGAEILQTVSDGFRGVLSGLWKSIAADQDTTTRDEKRQDAMKQKLEFKNDDKDVTGLANKGGSQRQTQTVYPSALQAFFTVFEPQNDLQPRGSPLFVDADNEDQGIFGLLTTLNRAAVDGSKAAGELLARWVETQVLEDAGDLRDANGHSAGKTKSAFIISNILAPQSNDGEQHVGKPADPISPFILSLNEAAQAGSKSASAVLSHFFSSVIADQHLTSAPQKDSLAISALFADFFAKAAEKPESFQFSKDQVNRFLSYLESSARKGSKAAVSIIDSIFVAEEEPASRQARSSITSPKLSGNVFDFFVPQGDSESVAEFIQPLADFFDYLYKFTSAGDPNAAEILSQWVEATSRSAADAETHSASFRILSSVFAPQNLDDTSDSTTDSSYPEIWDKASQAFRNAQWQIPSSVRDAFRFLFVDNGVGEGRTASSSNELISAKDARQIQVLKERFRQIERRRLGKDLNTPLITTGEKFRSLIVKRAGGRRGTVESSKRAVANEFGRKAGDGSFKWASRFFADQDVDVKAESGGQSEHFEVTGDNAAIALGRKARDVSLKWASRIFADQDVGVKTQSGNVVNELGRQARDASYKWASRIFSDQDQDVKAESRGTTQKVKVADNNLLKWAAELFAQQGDEQARPVAQADTSSSKAVSPANWISAFIADQYGDLLQPSEPESSEKFKFTSFLADRVQKPAKTPETVQEILKYFDEGQLSKKLSSIINSVFINDDATPENRRTGSKATKPKSTDSMFIDGFFDNEGSSRQAADWVENVASKVSSAFKDVARVNEATREYKSGSSKPKKHKSTDSMFVDGLFEDGASSRQAADWVGNVASNVASAFADVTGRDEATREYKSGSSKPKKHKSTKSMFVDEFFEDGGSSRQAADWVGNVASKVASAFADVTAGDEETRDSKFGSGVFVDQRDAAEVPAKSGKWIKSASSVFVDQRDSEEVPSASNEWINKVSTKFTSAFKPQESDHNSESNSIFVDPLPTQAEATASTQWFTNVASSVASAFRNHILSEDFKRLEDESRPVDVKSSNWVSDLAATLSSTFSSSNGGDSDWSLANVFNNAFGAEPAPEVDNTVASPQQTRKQMQGELDGTWTRGNPERIRKHLTQSTHANPPPPPLETTCPTRWHGIDPSFDAHCASTCHRGTICKDASCTCGRTMLKCGDNRYVTRRGSLFLCESACLLGNCPASHCACATSAKSRGVGVCESPRRCNDGAFVAVGGVASDEWCNETCRGSYCPCSLCKCANVCSSGFVSGGFEEGLDGWVVVREGGSKGVVTTIDDGGVGVSSGKRVTARVGKGRVGIIDFGGKGSYAMYQVVKVVGGDSLSFKWTVINWAEQFVQGSGMTKNGQANQQFRVDVVDADSLEGFKWFEVSETDDTWSTRESRKKVASILSPSRVSNVMNAIGRPPFTDAGPWQLSKYDLSSFAGRKVAVIFRAVANTGPMTVALDDVKILNGGCTPPDVQDQTGSHQEVILVETN